MDSRTKIPRKYKLPPLKFPPPDPTLTADERRTILTSHIVTVAHLLGSLAADAEAFEKSQC